MIILSDIQFECDVQELVSDVGYLLCMHFMLSRQNVGCEKALEEGLHYFYS